MKSLVLVAISILTITANAIPNLDGTYTVENALCMRPKEGARLTIECRDERGTTVTLQTLQRGVVMLQELRDGYAQFFVTMNEQISRDGDLVDKRYFRDIRDGFMWGAYISRGNSVIGMTEIRFYEDHSGKYMLNVNNGKDGGWLLILSKQ